MESAVIEVSGTEPDLPIIVTEAGADSLVLGSLVRQAIPILENPSNFLPAMRRKLAGLMRSALEVIITEDEIDDVRDYQNEPPHTDGLPDDLPGEPLQ